MKARLAAALVLVAAVAAGFLLGVAADRVAFVRRGVLMPGDLLPRARVGYLLRQLDLVPAQRAAVDSILAARRDEASRIRRRMLPEVEAMRARTEADLRAVLTREQAERFDRALARLRDRGSGAGFLPHRHAVVDSP